MLLKTQVMLCIKSVTHIHDGTSARKRKSRRKEIFNYYFTVSGIDYFNAILVYDKVTNSKLWNSLIIIQIFYLRKREH